MNGLTAVRGKALLIDKNYEVHLKEIVTKKWPSAEASLRDNNKIKTPGTICLLNSCVYLKPEDGTFNELKPIQHVQVHSDNEWIKDIIIQNCDHKLPIFISAYAFKAFLVIILKKIGLSEPWSCSNPLLNWVTAA